jgi:hypothetical protein
MHVTAVPPPAMWAVSRRKQAVVCVLRAGPSTWISIFQLL